MLIGETAIRYGLNSSDRKKHHEHVWQNSGSPNAGIERKGTRLVVLLPGPASISGYARRFAELCSR
jgi:hypothetical protein